jgi:hypothetical protein
MNGKYLFTLIMTMLTISLSAQQIGIRGGLNFINVASVEDIDLSTSNGFQAGLALDLPLVSAFRLATGLFYTRRGYQSNVEGMDGSVIIDYLDIPVDLMFRIKPLNTIGAYVAMGPYFSYGISSNVFDEDGFLVNGYSDETIDLNRIDSGINIGAGVEITSLRIGASYGFSFADNRSIRDIELKNRVFNLSVSYFLN